MKLSHILATLTIVFLFPIGTSAKHLIFNEGTRYSRLALESRTHDFYGNLRPMGFPVFVMDGSMDMTHNFPAKARLPSTTCQDSWPELLWRLLTFTSRRHGHAAYSTAWSGMQTCITTRCQARVEALTTSTRQRYTSLSTNLRRRGEPMPLSVMIQLS